MKETKQASGQPEARDVVREMMAAFEAFKGANDARLGEIERKAAADVLLEEKVARIDQAVASAQARLDRVMSQSRRPVIGGEPAEPTSAPEAKTAWDGYLKTGQSPHRAGGLEVKAGLSGGATSGGYVVPYETERAIERRLMAASPMREIATVRTVAAGVFRKPVSTAGVACGWVAETAARPETDAATLALLEFPSADLYANPAATQALLDDAMVDLDEWLAAEVEDAFAAQETQAFINGDGVNKPKGLLSYPTVADAGQAWGQIGYVPSGAAGGFAATSPADRLIDLIYAPKGPVPAERPVRDEPQDGLGRAQVQGRGRQLHLAAGDAAGRDGDPFGLSGDRDRDHAGRGGEQSVDRIRGLPAGVSDRRSGGRAGAARSLFGQALCAVLHDQARRRRGAEL